MHPSGASGSASSGAGGSTSSGGGGGVELQIKVVPGSSRSRVVGLLGDRLKIQVSAPPEAGKANQAVCELLAKELGIPKRQVEIRAGQSKPQKTVWLAGVTVAQVAAAFGNK
ncbi:MAG: DUF167 domain-containing protein [Phycisphaeraceae bacterium]|nr:DUF167 domain-containing protein [Phycisphaeraceae bacterium]